MKIEKDVMVPMGDGVRLATNVYRPADDAAHPTLIQRTPYGKENSHLLGSLLFTPEDAVLRGYAVVVQDARGTYGSEGVFRPIFQERSDGHDTLTWLLRQPWSDGIAGTYGSSYMGVTALQMTVDAPEGLKATLAYVTGANYHDDWTYCDGPFELGRSVRWAMEQAAAQLDRPEHRDRDVGNVMRQIEAYRSDPAEYLRGSLDIAELMSAVGNVMPHYRAYLAHPTYDAFWEEIDVIAAADRIGVPVLSIAGWHDAFLRSTLRLFDALRTHGPEQLREHHRLIVGPWEHESYLGVRTLSRGGARDFGPQARSGRAGLLRTSLDWFDRWLMPNTGAAGGGGAPVRFFHMGPDVWQEAAVWESRRREQRLYLASSGSANSSSGDGLLVPRPVDSPPDTFTYDPNSPVPTCGGRISLYHTAGGMQDQTVVESRDDVLVYTSSRLIEPVTVRGSVRLELHIRTSATTTDFVAYLVDVDVAGRPMNVADGAVRLEPGSYTEPSLVVIDLWDTAYTFPVGHRIRVHLTSSSFPRFDRNRNVDDSNPGAWSIATQEILHDPDHPSALVLGAP